LASLKLLPTTGTREVGFSSHPDENAVETVGYATDIFRPKRNLPRQSWGISFVV